MAKLGTFLLLILLFTAIPAYAKDSISLATADGPPLSNPDNTGFHDRIVLAMFSKMAIDIQIVRLPAERALINADTGVEDGVFVRVAGMENQYPNLIPVPEKITDYEFTAFTKHVNMTINGWDSLKPYGVGIITGWKILENNIRGTRDLLKVDNPEQLFGVLDKERVDIIVYNRYDGYGLLNQLNLKQIRTLEPPLASREMFLYLNMKYKHLAQKAAVALRAVKADGSYEKFFKETILPLMPD